MEHYAGIDVSLELSSVCVVDATGRIVREARVASEPEALVAWFRGLGIEVARVGLEAGPLSQWLYAAMRDAGLAVELLETRHVRDAFKSMPADYRHITKFQRIRFLESDIAIGDGTVVIARDGAADHEKPYLKVLFTCVGKKVKGQWRRAAIRLIPIIAK